MSPAGTDVTFALAGRPAFVNDGTVTAEDAKSELFLERWTTLPGGQVFTTVSEASGKGKVVVPGTQCMFKPMTGIAFEIREGEIRDFIDSVTAGTPPNVTFEGGRRALILSESALQSTRENRPIKVNYAPGA